MNPGSPSMSANGDIAFVRLGSFSHINESLKRELSRQFHGYRIDDVEVGDLVSRADRWGPANLLLLAADQRLKLATSAQRIREAVAKTDYIFKLSTARIRERLAGSRYACSLQTSVLYDASLPDTPHFIFADNTALANRHYAPESRPLLVPSTSWLRLERELFRKATAIFTMSDFCAQSLIDDYGCAPEAVVCVNSGTNVPAPAPIGEDRYAARRILFVGVDWRRKGGPELLDAFRQLRAWGVPATLTVVGCSPRISVPGCEVVGRVSPQALPRYFARASVFCMPSRREPSATAYAEASLYGLPVVATRIGGTPERVLQGTTGYLVQPGDTMGLARALQRLLDNPERCRRMGEEARRHIERAFTWERTVSIMKDRILDVIGQAA